MWRTSVACLGCIVCIANAATTAHPSTLHPCHIACIKASQTCSQQPVPSLFIVTFVPKLSPTTRKTNKSQTINIPDKGFVLPLACDALEYLVACLARVIFLVFCDDQLSVSLCDSGHYSYHFFVNSNYKVKTYQVIIIFLSYMMSIHQI